MSEYSVTKKAQEPLPPEAILQVKEDDKDIFGCADCGREFTDGKKRDDHFMSSDIQSTEKQKYGRNSIIQDRVE